MSSFQVFITLRCVLVDNDHKLTRKSACVDFAIQRSFSIALAFAAGARVHGYVYPFIYVRSNVLRELLIYL